MRGRRGVKGQHKGPYSYTRDRPTYVQTHSKYPREPQSNGILYAEFRSCACTYTAAMKNKIPARCNDHGEPVCRVVLIPDMGYHLGWAIQDLPSPMHVEKFD